MKIRHNCLLYLPTIILLFTLWDSKPFIAAATSGTNNNGDSSSSSSSNSGNNNGRRKKSTESSILEIMNTQEIEQLIAQRRINNNLTRSGGNQLKSNPLIIQNDLDEELEYLESSSNTPLLSSRYKSPNRRQQHHRNKQNHELFNSDFEYNGDGDDGGVGGGGVGHTVTSHQQQNQLKHRRYHHNDHQKLSSSSSIPQSIEVLQYNDSYYTDSRFFTTDQNLPNNLVVDPVRDLPRGDKILKSSKNALYITRKEYLKKDWCKTEPLVQRIRQQGCLTRTFVNRFCYGQCNSFYIPKSPSRKRKFHRTGGHEPIGSDGSNNNGGGSRINRYLPDDHFDDEDLTGAAFQSCGFCKPKKYTWITVTLRCPSLVPQLRKKRVQRIKQCKCMAEPLE